MHEQAVMPERGVRDLLRRLPVFDTDLPGFQPDMAPADPVTLFAEWLAGAIAAGVREPHAMSLATVGAGGRPSSRVLICKDVNPQGCWFFATASTSRKGRELAAHPYAALGFYWPQQGRQIRICGEVTPASVERLEADPRLVAPAWTLYELKAEEVEFWQADRGRRHIRLCYRRQDDQWHQERLWP